MLAPLSRHHPVELWDAVGRAGVATSQIARSVIGQMQAGAGGEGELRGPRALAKLVGDEIEDLRVFV